jgi:hypothetical protein
MKAQTLLDTNLTLGELTKRLGDDVGTLAGYTFAWDKYVYDVADGVADEMSNPKLGALTAERRDRAVAVLDTNLKVNDLMKLTVETGIDEVAGYIYTEDKNTFIVASLTDELMAKKAGFVFRT